MINVKGHESNIRYLLPEDCSRQAFKFVVRNARVYTDGVNDTYPVIIFIHKDSKIPAAYTGLERYINDYSEFKHQRGSTLYKKANAVCLFLNYILWKTTVNVLHECSLKEIRDFLVYLKNEHEGYDDPVEFLKLRAYIFGFLCRYYDNNRINLSFNYSSSDLKSDKYARDIRTGQFRLVDGYKNLGVKAPNMHRTKKNRVLFMEGKDLILYAAKKYDPMLVLPIAIQCYSGIREGEVVNLTIGGLTVKRGPYKAVSDIELSLEEEQKVFKNWKGLTDPGRIKKHISAKVYPLFFDEIIELYENHLAMMESYGYDTSPNCPLLLNKWGNPMTVSAYNSRVKRLFYDHFLPLFKMQCEMEGTLADNLAYIEIYENEYPGAHMFRHWSTNYLFVHENLSEPEIKELRRDKSMFSQDDYLHVTEEIRREYTSCVYSFQKYILEEITKNQ